MRLSALFRPSLVWLLVLGCCVTAFGLVTSVSASDDPPAEEGQDAAKNPEEGDPEEGTAKGSAEETEPLSSSALDLLLQEKGSTLLALVVVKFVPLGIGILLLILWWVKRCKIDAGELPPPARVEPTVLFAVPAALGLLILATQVLPLLFASVLSVGVAVQERPDSATAPAPATQGIAAEQAPGSEDAPGAVADDASEAPRKDAPKKELPLWIRILAMFLGTVPIAVVLLLRRRRVGRATSEERRSLFPERTPEPSPAPGMGRAFKLGWWGFCVATTLVVPVATVWVLLLERIGVGAEAQDLVSRVVNPGPTYVPILIAVFGIFVAPLVEETLFRGLLYPALRRSLGGGTRAVWISAILVSLLFAAIHPSVMAFLPLFVLAMVLAWIMETTNSLAACVFVHAIHNASTLVPLVLLRFA